jgi:RHS repeat-associated protein
MAMDSPSDARPRGALLISMLLLAPVAADAGIGRTRGFADVSDDGQARYAIPIAVPPGTNGMTPALSLEYSHRHRGGLLGVGWSLGGLSQITRCARTVAQDGVAAPAMRGLADRFCLDGQRLVVANGAAYGSPAAEYRTEIESFARVRTASGSATTGPGHFVVETADGRIHEYGATNDSRIDGASGPTANAARAWALNRIRDRAGNVIDFAYAEDPASAVARIAAIRYNANPANGVSATHDIAFAYELRPSDEVDTGYVAATPVREVMRLTRIEVRHGGAIVRRYRLAYEPALSSGGRSRLATITECGAGGSDCLAPTRFAWQDGSPGASAQAAFAAQIPSPSTLPAGGAWNLADVNGDGRPDYLWASGATQASATVQYRLSLADGAFGPAVNSGAAAPRGIGAPFDANGDGRADLLMYSPAGTWAIAYGKAGGLGAAVDTGLALPQGARDFRGADLNGDGLGDIAWSEAPDPGVNSLRVRARFATSPGVFGAAVTLYSQWEAVGYQDSEGGDFIGEPGRRVDLDGDGAEDLLMNENYSIARISDAGHGTDRFDFPVFGGVALEFNDDACTDFAYKHIGRGVLRVRLSPCGLAGNHTELQGPAWTGEARLAAHDWNGDGREDVMARGAGAWMVARSLGDAVAPLASTVVPHDEFAAITGLDLDGDGLDDFAMRTGTQVRVRFRDGPVPDVLVSATDGFGVEARFTYRPLTDAAVHAAGSGAAWPEQDLQTNDLVVATLAVTNGRGNGSRSSAAFRYEGLRRNSQGRGSLGFRRLVRTELGVAEPLGSEVTRHQGYPFTGVVESRVLRQASGKPVASTEFRWSALTLGSGANARRYPYASTVTERRYEAGGALDGSEISRTVRTVAAIDAQSGLVTDETLTTSEVGGGANPASSSTLRTLHTGVLNDTASWCMGRSLSVEVTASHTLPGGAPIVRTADQEWDAPRCRPTLVRLLPGNSQLQMVTQLAYDAFGNVSSEKVSGSGAATRTVTTNWGPQGRLPARVTNPLSQSEQFAWDPGSGNALSFTDPNGLVTRWSYDAFGRPALERQPDGTETRWTRESCKAGCDARTKYRIRQDEVDVAGAVRQSAWLEVDQHDRGFRLETLAPGGGRSVSTVDSGARGEIVRQHLPHWDGGLPPGYREFTYDALGRPTGIKLLAFGGAMLRSVALTHDGLTLTRTDGLGRSTATTRDAWGNVAEIVDALGGRARYEYDAFGSLVRARDALGNTIASIGYDARGMKVSVADMDLGTWTWTRNGLGETKALRDAKGQVTRFSYDALGRLVQRTAAEGASTWTWGATPSKKDVGRLVSRTGPGFSETLAYDGAGRPASRTIAADGSHRFDYAYNGLGLLDTLTYPASAGGRFRIRHDYDAGRLVRISDADAAGGTLWSLGAEDARGNALDETLGATVRVISGFSPQGGELEYRQAGAGGGTAIQDLAYDWDGAGNLASRSDMNLGLVEAFRYDDLGRLRESRRNGVLDLEVEYDAIGNIRRKSDACTGAAPCYAYHATRRHAVTAVGSQAFTYDANGNMTRRAGATIAWSSDNRPVSIAHANGNLSAFSYAPDGDRWKQVATHGAASETTIYAGGLFEKVTAAGATTFRHYVPAPGGIALHLRYANGVPAATRYLTLDHLGSTDRILDAGGKVLVTEGFRPFGGRRRPDGGDPTAADLAKIAAATRDGFTGHEHLDNLGLVHMNGRVYDPLIGRFLGADPYVSLPYDGQGLNRYSYVLNNPLLLTDPSGYDATPCLATESGNCVRIVVIGASWSQVLRSAGGAHASEIASALERDPCGQNGNASACSMQAVTLAGPSSVVLTVGNRPHPEISGGGRLDAIQGFAARVGNLAIHASPVALLFGSDPDFQFFGEPESDGGRLGAAVGDVGMALGGVAGIVRKGGTELLVRGPSALARSMQGTARYPNVDRFRNIVLKKGTLVYGGFPGQGAFYTTARSLRRAGASAAKLWDGLQVAAHDTLPPRARMAAYEIVEDTQAAFGLALANTANGAGGYAQIVVPSFRTSLRYLTDFALAP